MSAVWISVGSRTDLSAGSSSSVLHSIYGSQVSQLPISDLHLEDLEENDSEQWTRVRFSSPHLLRPRSAYANLARSPRRRILSDPPFCNDKLSQETLMKHPSRTLSRPKSAHSSQVSFRPKSALPALHNMSRDTTRKRPVTAHSRHSVDNSSFHETRLSSAKFKEPRSPVVVSSTPQYFDFWNEKPLKPRDWTVKTQSPKQWKRPKSSYGSLAGSHGRRKVEDKIKGNKAEEKAETKYDSLLLGTTEERGNNEEKNSNESKFNGDNSHPDNLGGEFDGNGSYNYMNSGDADGSRMVMPLDRGDEDRDKSLQNNRNKDSHLLTNVDKNDKLLKDILGRDDSNDAELDAYFDLQGKNNSGGKESSSWLDNLSSSACKTRFNLPVDMKVLEGCFKHLITLSQNYVLCSLEMSPVDYLRSYCLLSDQRSSHYSKIFSSLARKSYMTTRNEVMQGLVDAHHKLLSKDQAESIIELVKLPATKLLVDKKIFGRMCAVADRIFGAICL